jgi:hypothetical protein
MKNQKEIKKNETENLEDNFKNAKTYKEKKSAAKAILEDTYKYYLKNPCGNLRYYVERDLEGFKNDNAEIIERTIKELEENTYLL